jgi:hypothetical protein
MKTPLIILRSVSLPVGALPGLPLLLGIWLPDVISAPKHMLAEQRLASGHSFRVIQHRLPWIARGSLLG